jgi:outer membrane protein insertion porin family
MNRLFFCMVFSLVGSNCLSLHAKEREQVIESISVVGNRKAESDAISSVFTLKKGDLLDRTKIQTDIREIYALGYFSKVDVYEKEQENGIALEIEVKEKPSITEITFTGLHELSEDEIRKQVETKPFTIVDEGGIANDLRMIEKKYYEKGFYLVDASYELQAKGEAEVILIFRVLEHGKVMIGDVFLVGNRFFSNDDLISKFASTPYTRTSAFGSSSLYKAENIARDAEFLSYYYKDNGFADVKVGKPIVEMDQDRRFARVTHQIEEGIQYFVKSVEVSGDVGLADLYTEKELIDWMSLGPKKLFRYGQFSKDVEMLVDKYGDLGYAYVDVNPLTDFDHENATVALHYQITKGRKIYFGKMNIVGNTKTRDNVIRRELEVHDSELYSGTKMSESKKNVNRLGFFEEVQVIKERDVEIEDLMHLKVKVKEKPTGQMQMALGFSPGGDTKAAWFGQGRYEDKNQSGRGWATSLMGRWASIESYQVDAGFYNPKLNDGDWSLGFNYEYSIQDRVYAYVAGVEVAQIQQAVSVTLGRKIVELLRGQVTARHSVIRDKEEVLIFDGFQSVGIKNSFILGLFRKDLDNYIDPTEGNVVQLRHNFTGGVFGGDFQFMETSLDGEYYLPIDFSDSFRTNIKFHSFFGMLQKMGHNPIPATERYRLGGFNNLRGFGFGTIGPSDRKTRSPLSSYYDYNKGGDREVFFQLEYFVPLIPQAGIKALVFSDSGRVYKEGEYLSLSQFDFDVGFGFRWVTPIAPFRFEWAFPYDKETKTLGDLQFIFNIGY